MFDESLKMLAMIHYGENKSWDIAQRMGLSIRRFRALVQTLLELSFICYDQDDCSYSLTQRGENMVKFADSQICAQS